MNWPFLFYIAGFAIAGASSLALAALWVGRGSCRACSRGLQAAPESNLISPRDRRWIRNIISSEPTKTDGTYDYQKKGRP